jgi:hypothetical protein
MGLIRILRYDYWHWGNLLFRADQHVNVYSLYYEIYEIFWKSLSAKVGKLQL